MSTDTETKNNIEPQNEYLIRINYKSGSSVECWFVEFDYKSVNGDVTIGWRVPPNSVRRPLVLSVDDIESIWIIDSRPATKTKKIR